MTQFEIEKLIFGVFASGFLLSCFLFVFTFIICRRGFQKHVDPHFLNVGHVRYINGNSSMDIALRTSLYLLAPFRQKTRDFRFEGKDPRKAMPKSLLRWVRICQVSGLLFIVFMAAFGIYGVATDQVALW